MADQTAARSDWRARCRTRSGEPVAAAARSTARARCRLFETVQFDVFGGCLERVGIDIDRHASGGRRVSPRPRAPGRPSPCRRRRPNAPPAWFTLQQTQAEPRRRVMAGAEAHRGQNDQMRSRQVGRAPARPTGGATTIRSTVTGSSDGLTSRGPVFVRNLDRRTRRRRPACLSGARQHRSRCRDGRKEHADPVWTIPRQPSVRPRLFRPASDRRRRSPGRTANGRRARGRCAPPVQRLAEQIFHAFEERLVALVCPSAVASIVSTGIVWPSSLDELLLLLAELPRHFDDHAHVQARPGRGRVTLGMPLPRNGEQRAARRACRDIDLERCPPGPSTLNEPPIAMIGYGTATSTKRSSSSRWKRRVRP